MSIQVTCATCKSQFNAPDNAVGKRTKCPKCGGVIDIQPTAPAPPPAAKEDEIVEAEEAPYTPFSDDDFEVEKPAELPAAGDRKPCPMCGEMIQKDAVKCRFCGEIFDPILKKQQGKKGAKPGDEDMSTGDWVVAIICSGIGCIAGIIWMIQGKPKGKKMLLVSICANLFWVVVRLILTAVVQPPHR